MIRLADPAEASLVREVMRAAFAESSALANPSSALRETDADVRRAMESGGAILLFHEHEAVGSARFVLDPTTLTFSRLAVLPSTRGQGRGAAMIAWLEDFATAKGCTEIRAEARSQQPDNRPYYLALGYEIVGYSGRYGIPDIRTHLRKRLTG